ncbi:unnamed protein product [Malus baccata var. baccata]
MITSAILTSKFSFLEEMSVLQAYPTPTPPTPTEDVTRPEPSMKKGLTGGLRIPFLTFRASERPKRHRYVTNSEPDYGESFADHVESNDWDNAIKLLGRDSQLGRCRFRYASDGTALHYAIQKRCSVRNIRRLVNLMEMKDMEIQDKDGFTALYTLILFYPGRVEVAECMVKKNHNLLTIMPDRLKVLPVVLAQRDPQMGRMARSLYFLTQHETLKVPVAAHLISLDFCYHRFDIAWDLIQRYPKLAMAEDHMGNFPLMTLARNPSAFKVRSRLNLWEKLIYCVIRIKPLPSINTDCHINFKKHESEQSDQGRLSDQKENQGHCLISSGMSLFRGLITILQALLDRLQTLLGINRIYQMKLMHERVKQFLPLMCKATSVESMTDYQKKKFKEALCVAAKQGHVEYIVHLIKHTSYPVFKAQNEEGQNLFQIAAECRQHKVYNLIYVIHKFYKKGDILDLDEFDEIQKIVYRSGDDFDNTILHTVARITPFSQIDHIQGAALKMQRELQWFKEVESISDPVQIELVNKDNKTPREIFTENHRELAKEAEESLKETATSCTVVGALIVTMMFAAVFTVPEGNDEKTGLPTFLTKKVVTTFIVSDAVSLFSSTTSVIMFLGILTSRFSEDDFYKSLPTKMIIGLFTLFLSIATMMIVFSCALYLMLDGKSSIVIPSIFLASVPVASFIWMQSPLLVELFISTFGRGIFDRKQKNVF